MNNNMENALPIINMTGVIALAIVTIYQNLVKGKEQVSSEVLALYKEQIAALKSDQDIGRSRSHDLANQVQALTLKVGNLEGSLKEKDKKLEEYLTILQGRNPQQEQFMTFMTESMSETSQILKKIMEKFEIQK